MQTLIERSNKHRSEGLYRARFVNSESNNFINFSSNDYLGLAKDPRLIANAQKAMDRYGVGSGASQLVTGYTDLHSECENKFAEFLKRDRALLFGNGYMANLGVIDGLMKKSDFVFQDRHNHASLLDAGRLSHAKSQRYLHKNIDDLMRRLQPSSHSLIVSDGVFSMLGDQAPIASLAKVSEKFNATLMIDDAHGIGVLGEYGRGSLEALKLSQLDVPILVCPLGKAFGVYGAIVAGSHNLIEALIQFARSYIYTTALPPALAAAAITSLDIVKRERWRQEKLFELIEFFKYEAKKRELPFAPSKTAIQAIRMKDASHAILTSNVLKTKGFIAYAMRPPSVPDKQSILRITLNATHLKTQIVDLLDALV